MRGISVTLVAVLGLAVAACGQSKSEAGGDLAAKLETAAPKPAEEGQVFVGEVTPAPLEVYTPPAEEEAEEETVTE
ncbi:MAG: hypothetical protein ACMVO5_12445 [Polymorphobacter sp.]|uniref:hypothetical protein n=1 Tax=Polymorphobacter sp. TaxID=1909290 RepID=UPI003A83588F